MNKVEIEIKNNIERFKNIINESNGTGEVCRKYKFCENGKSRNIIKKYIVQLNLNTDHFGLKNNPRTYNIIKKECPVCNNIFETLENHPKEKKTCSRNCGNKFFRRKHSDEEKKQISDALKLYYKSEERKKVVKKKQINVLENKSCKFCNIEFKPKNLKSKYCSNQCRNKCPDYRSLISKSVRERVANGTHNGWNSRKIISYPEQFFMNVLNNNNISYQHNKLVGKYFIDFAITEKMIALEIDGKQHQYEDRKKSDALKDKYLTNCGWTVYRIPWKSINNDTGKKYIKEKIDNFLLFYRHVVCDE